MHISQFVVDEVQAGNPMAAKARMKVIAGLPMLDVTKEVDLLMKALLGSGIIPIRAATDAAHIAIAAVHRMEFLMTWNCTHLANAMIARSVARICGRHGFECPVICTPEELLKGNQP